MILDLNPSTLTDVSKFLLHAISKMIKISRRKAVFNKLTKVYFFKPGLLV